MIVIVGESGCGKSSLAKAFVEKHKNYTNLVTYTTRPKRENEVDGVDYHFVTQEEYDRLANEGFFAEHNVYRGWSYGTASKDCDDSECTIAVLTPAGMRALKRAGVKMVVVYLEVDRRSRLINILRRGDDIEEAYRRSLSDVGQFDGISEESDYVILNAGYHMPVDQVCTVLAEIIKVAKEEGEY